MKIIAIDAGGTKTSFSLFDEKGKEVNNIELDTIHIFQKTEDEIIKILKTGINLIKPINEKYVVSIGTAAYGNDINIRNKINNIYKKAIDVDYKIFSDIKIAHVGALNGSDGITIISGTGSIALAKIKDKYVRVGGFGYLLGDEGSAYWIGKKVIEQFLKEVDGRREKTKLYKVLIKELNLRDEYELILKISKEKNYRKFIASLAPFAKYSEKIYEKAAYELSLHIKALQKYYGNNENIKLRYIGGVFKEKLIIKYLEKNLSNIEIKEAENNPRYGAYLLYNN